MESRINNYAGNTVQVLNTHCRGYLENPIELHLHQGGVQDLNKNEGTSIGAIDDAVIAREVISVDCNRTRAQRFLAARCR
jgi:hypothetical protein